MKINKNFLDLEESYLFSTVNKKTREFQAAHPEADVIKLSIGDVTKPLCPAVTRSVCGTLLTRPAVPTVWVCRSTTAI